MGTEAPVGPAKSVGRVALIEARCIIATVWLLLRGRLRLPRDHVDREVRFADGSTSRIYRETTLRPLAEAPRVVLVVRFRLRLIESSRIAHALFRFESLFNTLLFAAHEGFHTKLWLTDRVSDFYRGIYEWEDRQSAVEYAETLRVVLAPWVERGSFGYHVLGTTRDEYLAGVASVEPEHTPPVSPWWLPEPVEAVAVG